ncbi:MAG: 30S ribosomal protein S7, partial [Acidobacteria bacterium]|nr:30S ribosomal protein S7 [Acidobacteriota bacterium]
MPRRREIAKRELPPDALYGSPLVTKFINTIMLEGRR